MDPLKKSLDFCLRGNFLASEKILKSLDQSLPPVQFNLGWHCLRNENGFKEGYRRLDIGRSIGVFGDTKIRKTPKYNGEELKNKTVLLVGEGGHGDQIINIRFAKNLFEQGAKVIVSCDIPLFLLFKRIPYISAVCDRNYDSSVFHDYHIPCMSAPLHLNLSYKDITGEPYLQYFTSRNLLPIINENNLKVGLKWSGNPKYEHEQYRRFPTKKIQELLDIPGITFYSLQRDDNYIDDERIIDLRYDLKSWETTAEIIMELDLVITSCTSVAHLAAALGKPTWIILPVLSYYTWALPGNKSPWHKTATLYRQTVFENWDDPFLRLKKDLINYKESY